MVIVYRRQFPWAKIFFGLPTTIFSLRESFLHVWWGPVNSQCVLTIVKFHKHLITYEIHLVIDIFFAKRIIRPDKISVNPLSNQPPDMPEAEPRRGIEWKQDFKDFFAMKSTLCDWLFLWSHLKKVIIIIEHFLCCLFSIQSVIMKIVCWLFIFSSFRND